MTAEVQRRYNIIRLALRVLSRASHDGIEPDVNTLSEAIANKVGEDFDLVREVITGGNPPIIKEGKEWLNG